jgi:hypothetical protein
MERDSQGIYKPGFYHVGAKKVGGNCRHRVCVSRWLPSGTIYLPLRLPKETRMIWPHSVKVEIEIIEVIV